jgi:short-subunit dehydrogenase
MKTHDLAGKVVVITGASSGFGKGAAFRFAGEGASLVLAARRAELLDDMASVFASAGTEALSVPTDVSHRIEVEHLAQRAVDRFGRIDVWVNNAGVGAIGPFERIPLEDHVKVVEINLLGTLYGTYYAYQQFLRQRAGVLINIASELGQHTVPYFSSYAAAKHGIVGLDESLQQELSQLDLEDVHVCTVLPTAHDTPFFDHVANYSGHETAPPKPLHDPDDVVETILKLAIDPHDSEVVGGDGVVKVLMKRITPTLAKRMAARQVHANQIEKAPRARDKGGAVQAPMSEGTNVSAGRRKNG